MDAAVCKGASVLACSFSCLAREEAVDENGLHKMDMGLQDVRYVENLRNVAIVT